MRGRNKGHHGSINNAEVGGTINLEVVVDDTAEGTLQHDSGTGPVSKGGPGAVLDEVLDLLIGLDGRAGEDLHGLGGSDGRHGLEPAHVLEGLNHDVEIERVGESAEVNLGEIEGVAGLEINEATREGLLEGKSTATSTTGNLSSSGFGRSKHAEEKSLLESITGLDGDVNATAEVLRRRLEETLGDDLCSVDQASNLLEGDEGEQAVTLTNGERTSLVGSVLGDGSIIGRISRDDLGDVTARWGVGHDGGAEHGGVILEVLTNTGKVDDGLDSVAAQLGLGADTRELQDARSVDGASSHDDLTGSLDSQTGGLGIGSILDTGELVVGANLGVEKLGDVVLDENVEVGAVGDGVGILVPGIGASTVEVVQVGRSPEDTDGGTGGTVLGSVGTNLLESLVADLGNGVDFGRIRVLDGASVAVRAGHELNSEFLNKLIAGRVEALRLYTELATCSKSFFYRKKSNLPF